MDYLLNNKLNLWRYRNGKVIKVLNLIINGLSSKQIKETDVKMDSKSFKPYYKWTIF